MCCLYSRLLCSGHHLGSLSLVWTVCCTDITWVHSLQSGLYAVHQISFSDVSFVLLVPVHLDCMLYVRYHLVMCRLYSWFLCSDITWVHSLQSGLYAAPVQWTSLGFTLPSLDCMLYVRHHLVMCRLCSWLLCSDITWVHSLQSGLYAVHQISFSDVSFVLLVPVHLDCMLYVRYHLVMCRLCSWLLCSDITWVHSLQSGLYAVHQISFSDVSFVLLAPVHDITWVHSLQSGLYAVRQISFSDVSFVLLTPVHLDCMLYVRYHLVMCRLCSWLLCSDITWVHSLQSGLYAVRQISFSDVSFVLLTPTPNLKGIRQLYVREFPAWRNTSCTDVIDRRCPGKTFMRRKDISAYFYKVDNFPRIQLFLRPQPRVAELILAKASRALALAPQTGKGQKLGAPRPIDPKSRRALTRGSPSTDRETSREQPTREHWPPSRALRMCRWSIARTRDLRKVSNSLRATKPGGSVISLLSFYMGFRESLEHLFAASLIDENELAYGAVPDPREPHGAPESRSSPPEGPEDSLVRNAMEGIAHVKLSTCNRIQFTPADTFVKEENIAFCLTDRWTTRRTRASTRAKNILARAELTVICRHPEATDRRILSCTKKKIKRPAGRFSIPGTPRRCFFRIKSGPGAEPGLMSLMRALTSREKTGSIQWISLPGGGSKRFIPGESHRAERTRRVSNGTDRKHGPSTLDQPSWTFAIKVLGTSILSTNASIHSRFLKTSDDQYSLSSRTNSWVDCSSSQNSLIPVLHPHSYPHPQSQGPPFRQRGPKEQEEIPGNQRAPQHRPAALNRPDRTKEATFLFVRAIATPEGDRDPKMLLSIVSCNQTGRSNQYRQLPHAEGRHGTCVHPKKKSLAIAKPRCKIVVMASSLTRNTYSLLGLIRGSLMGVTTTPQYLHTSLPLQNVETWPNSWHLKYVIAPQSPQPCRSTTIRTINRIQQESFGQKERPP
ncbi:hypothetical protein J6590_018972 [Homalodisca vitripennis]|nr:hypothetical protein J6590_018972 [Homalodisca vitripennis]